MRKLGLATVESLMGRISDLRMWNGGGLEPLTQRLSNKKVTRLAAGGARLEELTSPDPAAIDGLLNAIADVSREVRMPRRYHDRRSCPARDVRFDGNP